MKSMPNANVFDFKLDEEHVTVKGDEHSFIVVFYSLDDFSIVFNASFSLFKYERSLPRCQERCNFVATKERLVFPRNNFFENSKTLSSECISARGKEARRYESRSR